MHEHAMTDRMPLIIVAAVSMLMTTLLYVIGMFVIADFLPPPSPAPGEAEVAAFYRHNRISIITGLTMGLVGTGFMLPLCLIGSVFLSEAEKGFPFFSVMQALCAVVTVLFTAFPHFVWLTAAFRVERAPELIALLHDLGWIMWATPSWGFAFQLICVGVVGLRDTRTTPVLPRWMSYLAFWVALGMSYTPLVPFYTEAGPFAWNGLFSFWVAFFSPILWIGVLALLVIRNIARNPTPCRENSP